MARYDKPKWIWQKDETSNEEECVHDWQMTKDLIFIGHSIISSKRDEAAPKNETKKTKELPHFAEIQGPFVVSATWDKFTKKREQVEKATSYPSNRTKLERQHPVGHDDAQKKAQGSSKEAGSAHETTNGSEQFWVLRFPFLHDNEVEKKAWTEMIAFKSFQRKE